MKNRITGLAILAFLGLGLTIAYAQMPVKKKRNLVRQRPAGIVAVKHIVEPRNPNAPTAQQVLAEARQKFLNLPFEGTQVQVEPGVTGDTRTLHQKIADALNKENLLPLARTAHFAWLGNDPEIRHRGWHGSIVSVTPVSGAWSVKVSFGPLIDHMGVGQRVVTGDRVHETYIFDGLHVKYIGSADVPGAAPGVFVD